MCIRFFFCVNKCATNYFTGARRTGVDTGSRINFASLSLSLSQVVSAKVVARSRSRSHRYGFVTMSSVEQADACIKALNDTELKGSKIIVELVM